MIERVKLYDLEIVEIEGEFKELKRNEETLPAMLTNHALYVGKRDGLLETSLTDELYNVISVFEGAKVNPLNVKEENLAEFGADMLKEFSRVADEEKMERIIYLGLIGANPKLTYTFEEFILKYHGDLTEKITAYVGLISTLVSKDNDFKIEFEKMTSTKRAKGEKK